MRWPVLSKASLLQKGEFERFAKYWKQKGVFVELGGNSSEANSLSLQVTNSVKPSENVSGVWFRAWSERIENIREQAQADLEKRYPDSDELKRLLALGFNPGVWIGPDFEPRYFSEKAQDLILENVSKIEKLVEIATVSPSSQPESVAAYAVPAVFLQLGEHLTEQHINILLEGVAGLPADVRDEALAYALPAVIRAKSAEHLSPTELIEACRMLNLMTLGIPPDDHRDMTPQKFAKIKERLGILGRGLTLPDAKDQHRGKIMKYIGELIDAMGSRYTPRHLLALVRHFDLAPKDVELLISNFGGSFFERSEEPVSSLDFEKCLSLARRVTEKLPPRVAAELVYRDLPHFLKTSKTDGKTTVELFEKIISDLEHVLTNSQIPASILSEVGSWSWRIPFEAREALSLDDMRPVIDEFLRIEKITTIDTAKVIFDVVLSSVFMARDHVIRDDKTNPRNNEYVSPELIRQYVDVIQKTPHRRLEKFLSMDKTDLRHLLHESMNAMSPEVLNRYIELIAISTVSTIKTASKIWESADKDIDPAIVDKALLIAGRINAAVEKIGSQTPLEALDHVTGPRGMGNDDKPGIETIALAEGYAEFLESETERIKEICPPIPGPDDYEHSKAGWDQETALLKEFVLRHNGQVTTSTEWRIPDWKKEEGLE